MDTLLHLDLTNPRVLLGVFLAIFGILMIRYVLLSGAYYLIFLVVLRERYENRILTRKLPTNVQIIREIRLSVYSSLIFAGVTIGLLWLWQNGYTRVYEHISEYPLWYFPISVLLFLLLHDTYYYWLHKWMHEVKWIQPYHLAHHKSVDTTVLTSFSFHPIESFFQAIIIPIILVLVPLHPIAILLVLLIMTVSAIINHAGVEVYPGSEVWGRFRKYVIGATHHDIHHRNSKKNFGLYFTFWDRWMNTEYEPR